jgi:hypothetical protein
MHKVLSYITAKTTASKALVPAVRQASVSRCQKRLQCGAVTSSRRNQGPLTAGLTIPQSDEGAVTE